MADLNIEKIYYRQNTNAVSQISSKNFSASTSDPIDMGAGRTLPDGPLIEKAKRKKE